MTSKDIRSEIFSNRERITPERVILEDPLSDLTRRVRRNLLVASSVGIIVGVTNMRIQNFVFFVPNEQVSVEFTSGAFCVIVIYLLLAFCLYLYQDVAVWKTREAFSFSYSVGANYQNLIKTLNEFKDTAERLSRADKKGELDEKDYKRLKLALSRAESACKEHEKAVGALKKLRRVKWLGFHFVDITLPLIVACLALFFLGGGIPMFVDVLLNAV